MVRRQHVEIAVKQLVAAINEELATYQPRSEKLANVLSHTDYALTALNQLVSKRYAVTLLSRFQIDALKQMVAMSVSTAIRTRTNVMTVQDKAKRRYKLSNMLTRSVLYYITQTEIELMTELAAESELPLTIKLNGVEHTLPIFSSAVDMRRHIDKHFNIHPLSDVNLYV